MEGMQVHFKKWRERLLDIGKQNRLISCRETKHGSLKLVSPDLDVIYEQLVVREQKLSFGNEEDGLILRSNRTETVERQTLKTLRDKSIIAMEEQGVPILFLAFGFLKWKEDVELTSPLVLLPVNLLCNTEHTKYTIQGFEEGIITNPTLTYKLEQELELSLPQFDKDQESILDYLMRVQDSVEHKGFEVTFDCMMGLFSYLKMTMYEDLGANEENIYEHPVLRAFLGDKSRLPDIPEQYNHYNHDEYGKPAETFQVLDADSSQQDAILYSKQGVSFVLQGPPGTGKSQTITNIIAEALALNKKVLFVSEKMAALEVVYQKMQEVGLADFCLPLHSHKANKKEVMDELGRTLLLDPVQAKDENIYELEALKEQRKRLNQYAEELHTICEPLHASIYEINGRLSKLYMRPDVEFEMDHAAGMTKDELHQYMYVLSEYEKVLDKFSCHLKAHPVYGLKKESLSREERHDIIVGMEEISGKIATLNDVLHGIMEEFDLYVPPSMEGAKELQAILNLAKNAPEVPKQLIYVEDVKKTEGLAGNAQDVFNEKERLEEVLEEAFLVDYKEVDGTEAVHQLDLMIDEIKEFLNPKQFLSNNEIMTAMPMLLPLLEDERIAIQKAMDAEKVLAGLLEITPARNLNELEQHVKEYEWLKLDTNPTIGWFDRAKYKSNQHKLEEITSLQEAKAALEDDILDDFVPEIFRLDAEDLLYKFEHEYVGVTKVLRREYRRDMDRIRKMSRNVHAKLEDDDVIQILTALSKVKDYEAALSPKADWMKRYLGNYYQGSTTNYDLVNKKLKEFKQILDYYQDTPMPEYLKKALLDGVSMDEMFHQNFYTLHAFVNQRHDQVLIQLFGTETDWTDALFESTLQVICETSEKMAMLDQIISLVRIKPESKMPYTERYSIFKKLVRYQQIEEEYKDLKRELKRVFGAIYQEEETDWNLIKDSLSWLSKMREYTREQKVSIRFIESCLVKDKKEGLTDTRNYLNWCVDDITKDFVWFESLFDEQLDLSNEKLYVILNNLEQVGLKPELLDQWIEYKKVRKDCETLGLKEYLDEIEEKDVNPSLTTDTFLKRFYSLWLDSVVPNYPAVSSFGVSGFEDTRNDFDKLDVNQLAIARARINERILKNRPNLDIALNADDEVGILKRELNKKHKTMSLRRLFETIPNLLTSLKPCFMMSPLSVSLFLPSDLYEFDLVIFDEASQIRTEDAIGAILRGKQVVIAGDSEQLPPTNFFSKQVSTEAEDSDNYFIATAQPEKETYESVLEEAETILPERTLRWHYRSKDESLIAFSNAKIYNHNLITFPSTYEYEEHSGVEYIYVEDAIYDRGGKKHNEKEALKAAELIMEHARERSSRSLGVITFSESQQREVERQLSILRKENPEVEDFFAEDKKEPFFIKNLENVQGDERDTIIFSIGYGKDASGNLSMNFGPLSKKGGYRRLNVAVTRAKYNLKLVGSILPDDMDVSNSSTEGVKMLKSYMEYARNRKEVLKRELTFNDRSLLAAPFEEAIYEYLTSHDYEVEMKVGCSGYRIDLAVVHPNKPGHYVLGIQCDGETYHSARTARERERLRHTVLNDMGWNICRIYSTDWIKNPFIEGQKLLEIIENSINSYC
ncbi:DNA helicase related protein [Lachnospiraceae bacterium KM106-2]|nr:DNA helicase related protein [Lachnospiraceae bacterium KM106-2]